MSRRSPALWARGIGSNNALSFWSWLLTLPLALTVMNMFAGSVTLAGTGSVPLAEEASGTAEPQRQNYDGVRHLRVPGRLPPPPGGLVRAGAEYRGPE